MSTLKAWLRDHCAGYLDAFRRHADPAVIQYVEAPESSSEYDGRVCWITGFQHYVVFGPVRNELVPACPHCGLLWMAATEDAVQIVLRASTWTPVDEASIGPVPSRLPSRPGSAVAWNARTGECHELSAFAPHPHCPRCSAIPRAKRLTVEHTDIQLLELLQDPLAGLIYGHTTIYSLDDGDDEDDALHVIALWHRNPAFGIVPGESRLTTSDGIGRRRELALRKSLFESFERLAIQCPMPADVITCRGPVPPDGDALDLGLLAKPESIDWIDGTRADGRRVWVPRHMIWPEDGRRVSSSGCASHRDRWAAMQSALLELVERDNILRAWLSQDPGFALPKSVCQLESVRRWTRDLHVLGYDVFLREVTRIPGVPVVEAMARCRSKQGGPAAIFGGAAALALDEATDAALAEVVAGAAFATVGSPRTTPTPTPAEVWGAGEHAAFYADRKNLGWIEHYMHPRPPRLALAPGAAVRSSQDGLRRLDAILAAHGIETAFVETTPRWLAPLGVVVIRALCPAFIPLEFGTGRIARQTSLEAHIEAQPEGLEVPHPIA